MRIRRLSAVLGLLLVPIAVSAHPAPFSYVDLQVTRDGIDAAVVMHAFDIAHDLGLSSEDRVFDADFVQNNGAKLTAMVMSRFSLTVKGTEMTPTPVDVSVVPDRRGARVRLHYTASNPAVLQIHCSLFPYDPSHQTFLNIYEGAQLTRQMILDAGQTSVTHYMGTTQGTLAVIKKFVLAGIEHIAIGPDHILFLVGLLLLGGSVAQLLKRSEERR